MEDEIVNERRVVEYEEEVRDLEEARLSRMVLWLCLLNTLFAFLVIILWLPFFVTSMLILRLVWNSTHRARSWLALVWTVALWYWIYYEFTTTSFG